MTQESNWEAFPWLTEHDIKDDLETIFGYAVPSTNERIQERKSAAPEVWADMPRIDKAKTIRGELLGHVISACASYDNIVVREENHITFLEFPNGKMSTIHKTTEPLVAPKESKTLKLARLEREYLLNRDWPPPERLVGQLSFASSELEEEQEQEALEDAANSLDRPLAYLQLFPIVYVCKGDEIIALHVQDVDQANELVRQYATFDLSTPATEAIEVDAPIVTPRPSFTINKRNDTEDEEEGTA